MLRHLKKIGKETNQSSLFITKPLYWLGWRRLAPFLLLSATIVWFSQMMNDPRLSIS